ncbi:hypothetical protein [Rhizomicrobium electricum]|jgi:hypothetical protein|uniref:Uncharacterized protein n=1 Tax=Rhizomicrobium electricum TaxID=480070 RepID=A0ABP3PF69_9PROT|nr:hypothetical protein [Rhizomicrobium electricum]NIJ48487.1 hypothetical protein [Rhizomicrobium electricum]
MPKEDKDLIPEYDVQVTPVSMAGAPIATQSAGPAGVPMQVPGGGGYVLTSGSNAPIIVQSAQPSLLVITLAPKKEGKKEKKSSSVFQRL